jgi:hypothetical protein
MCSSPPEKWVVTVVGSVRLSVWSLDGGIDGFWPGHWLCWLLLEQVVMTTSVIEFMDKFGANPRQFETQIADLNRRQREAETAYIQGELQEAARILTETNSQLREISSEMMEAKNRAMLLIFIAELLAVSGTAMISGFILWTMMVKRRLYREVEATKLAQAE